MEYYLCTISYVVQGITISEPMDSLILVKASSLENAKIAAEESFKETSKKLGLKTGILGTKVQDTIIGK